MRYVAAIVGLFIVGALLLAGAETIGGSTSARDAAPFQLPGYRYVGQIDLTQYGSDGRPPIVQDLAFSRDGTLYTGDVTTTRILALNRDGSYRASPPLAAPPDMAEIYRVAEERQVPPARIVGDRLAVAVGPDGSIYASPHFYRRVFKLSSAWKTLAEWQLPVPPDMQGVFSAQFLAAGDNSVFIAERDNCAIGVLRPDGTIDQHINSDDDCQFGLFSIAISNERLYVAGGRLSDSEAAFEVPVYTTNGELIEIIGVDAVRARFPAPGAIIPFEVVPRDDGSLLVLTTTLVRRSDQPSPPDFIIECWIIGGAGEVLGRTEMPSTPNLVEAAIGPNERLAISYRDEARILLFEPKS